MPDLHAWLELRETGNVSFERHDLSVYRKTYGLLFSKCSHQFRVLVVELILIAGEKVNITFGPNCQAAQRLIVRT